MKKRIASVVCAAMLMLALPTLAWADPSPSGSTATSPSGISATVSGNATVSASADGTFTVGNVAAGETLTMTFNVGAQNAGRTATFVIQYADGTTATVSGVVAADGTVSIDINQDAVISVALSGEATGATGTTGAKADKSGKSPATGVDMGVVAGASAVALCGAGVVTVALRKKVNE